MKIRSVTDANFDGEVIAADAPVLLAFVADWCGPSKALAPELVSIADDMAGRVTIATMNIDGNPDIPDRYAIKSIPSLLLFVGGECIAVREGGGRKLEIKSWVRGHL